MPNRLDWIDCEIACLLVGAFCFFTGIILGVFGHPVAATILVTIFALTFIGSLAITFKTKE